VNVAEISMSEEDLEGILTFKEPQTRKSEARNHTSTTWCEQLGKQEFKHSGTGIMEAWEIRTEGQIVGIEDSMRMLKRRSRLNINKMKVILERYNAKGSRGSAMITLSRIRAKTIAVSIVNER
jgi:hypothetical protein